MNFEFSEMKWFLFSFKGRISRQPFWAFTLCAGLIWLILSLLLGIDILHRNKDVKSLIPMLILLWPSLAAQAKRWHDRDKSAWWILIGLIPIVGPIWTFVETGCLAGTEGENRFGEDPLDRTPKEPMPARTTQQAIPQPQSTRQPYSKSEKYYLSSFMKTMMVGGIVLVIFGSFFLVAVSKLTSAGLPGGVIPFAVMDTLFIAVFVWRAFTPIVEITEMGIKVGIPFIFKTNSARWDEIDGMVVGELNTLGFKEKNVKILLKSGKASTKELFFSLKAVERPDEIVERLRAKIPEIRLDSIRDAAVLRMPSSGKAVTYRGWALMPSGMAGKKEKISWGDIKELKYSSLVISGYGPMTITYALKGGSDRTIIVKPSMKEEYRDFMRYAVLHSYNAAIDPGLIKALEYSPKEAKTDTLSVLFFLSGLVLLFVAISTIMYYSPSTTGSGGLYMFLLVPFGLVPMMLSLKSLVARFQGKSETSPRKLLWAGLFNGGMLASVLVFFMLSPYSLNWLAGDISRKANNSEKAEQYYQTALRNNPEGIDVLYEMGKLEMAKKDYPKAFDYLKKAYTKDPTYWGPKAVVLVPDVLMKMGRYDEAMDWCKRIQKDFPGRGGVAREISKKQDEIIDERDMSKRVSKQS
ncbi:MAG: DUF805 domain-containing protein [Nitrospiraceae bacterium]|nr:DUF805 domain-containing protein [Nitrospiraceae bacterium]